MCEYSCKTPCGKDTTLTSNAITFTATPFFGRWIPSYQWLVNGSPAGSNTTTFSSSVIPDGASVECLMTVSHPACQGSTKDLSNAIPITVHKIITPDVKITASATPVCKGSPVTFTTRDASKGWNGIYQGKPLPTGTYVYLLRGKNEDDDIMLNGAVMLVR